MKQGSYTTAAKTNIIEKHAAKSALSENNHRKLQIFSWRLSAKIVRFLETRPQDFDEF